MSKYKEKLIDYHRLRDSIETLNNMGIKEIKKGNIEYGKSMLSARDKGIEEIKEYEEDYSVSTGNLRALVYELLKESSLTKEELDQKLGCTIGTIDNLLTNGVIELDAFNKIFEYFGIPKIKERFKWYIRN